MKEWIRDKRSRLALARFGLILGGFLVCGVGIESAFRLVGIGPERRRLRVDVPIRDPRTPDRPAPFGFYPFATIRSIYDTNPRGYFDSENGVNMTFNSVGWRDMEHVREKPPGVFRILGLGDSYLMGQGVRWEDICLIRLGKFLDETHPLRPVEVIASGYSGFNTVNERDLLEKQGLAYSPDLVILFFVLNDVEPEIYSKRPKVEFSEEYVNAYLAAEGEDWLSLHSNAWGWARQRSLRTIRARRYLRQCLESYSQDPAKWEICSSALLDIQRLCAEHGARFMVALFPFLVSLRKGYPFQPIHDQLREFCVSRRIPFLDLWAAFKNYDGPELWVHPVDQHPNEIAHDLAARELLKFLRDPETGSDLLESIPPQ